MTTLSHCVADDERVPGKDYGAGRCCIGPVELFYASQCSVREMPSVYIIGCILDAASASDASFFFCVLHGVVCKYHSTMECIIRSTILRGTGRLRGLNWKSGRPERGRQSVNPRGQVVIDLHCTHHVRDCALEPHIGLSSGRNGTWSMDHKSMFSCVCVCTVGCALGRRNDILIRPSNQCASEGRNALPRQSYSLQLDCLQSWGHVRE